MNVTRPALSAVVAIGFVLGLAAGPVRAVEQGTITVTKTWAAGQEPSEVVEVCFFVSADAAGNDVLGQACTSDETYTVVFGPTDPDLQTGVTYYVWEETGTGWSVTGDNPVAAVIPDTTGNVDVAFENARVEGTGSVELHKRVCPNGPPTTDIFTECHGTVPDQPVAFAVDGGEPQVVDDAGNVVFTGLTAGTHAFAETEGPPLDFVDLRVFCSVQGDGSEATEIATDGPNFAVDVPADGYVVCDVYNIPENLKGEEPTATPGAQLPGTGTGPAASDGSGGLSYTVIAAFVASGMAFGLRRRAPR
jgi:hypothetical protein